MRAPAAAAVVALLCGAVGYASYGASGAAVGSLGSAALVALLTRRALPPAPLLRPVTAGHQASPHFPRLRRISSIVSQTTTTSAHYYEAVTRPFLAELAQALLPERHRVDSYTDAERARALLGQDVWTLVDPAAPDGRIRTPWASLLRKPSSRGWRCCDAYPGRDDDPVRGRPRRARPMTRRAVCRLPAGPSRCPRERPCAHRGQAGCGQDAAGSLDGDRSVSALHPDPVHTGPAALRRHRRVVVRPTGGGLLLPPGPGLHEPVAGRRDQPDPTENPVRTSGGDGEQQVTVDGETLALPDPFVVLATENPIEYEGTYPLPEAQLDRFMLRVRLGYLQHPGSRRWRGGASIGALPRSRAPSRWPTRASSGRCAPRSRRSRWHATRSPSSPPRETTRSSSWGRAPVAPST